ncbi:MAG: TolC family protein [Ignavibacteria bacterium]
MRNLIIATYCIIMFVFSTNIYAQRKITLDEAVSIALNQNTDILKSQNSLNTYKAGIKSAYGNFLPTLSVSSGWSWQRTSDDGGTQIDYFGEEEEIEASETDSRSYSLSAGGNVTLFDGLSSFANLNQKENEYEAAKLDLDKLRQDIIYQTADYFFTVMSYNKLLEYQEENYEYNTVLLEQMEEMKNLNMISIADFYSQEVQTANAELSLLEAKANFEKAKITFLNYLSLDISEDYVFDLTEEEKQYTQFSNESFNELYEMALANRKDYQSKKIELENAENDLTSARSGYFPTLSGSYRLSTSAVSPGELLNRRVYSIGLSLSMPIFSGWSTDYSVETAHVGIQNTNEELLDLERTIKSEVMNVMLDLQTAKKQVEVTEKAIKSAEESWKIKKESYEIGKVTYIDLQLSYSDLVSAQNNNIQAKYSYYTTNYELMNIIGKLTHN